ncbi:hypothetical protein [Desulfobacula sp.]|uniref:hypothetical protein n=1 Tax=Desulfobacula sp. TaxID=2593537 RepID=UPI00260C562A|nr:hypothetical protein [Desulfobacula sp.]
MAYIDKETTLGDLNRMDRDNFAHVMKRDAKTYKFQTAKAARLFMGQCVDKIMRKCGIKIRPGMDGKRISRLMASRKVKVEHRVYDEKEPLYQTGLFIYDNLEIAGFVSSPFKQESEIDLIPAFYIRTTVKGVG